MQNNFLIYEFMNIQNNKKKTKEKKDESKNKNKRQVIVCFVVDIYIYQGIYIPWSNIIYLLDVFFKNKKT